MRASRLSWLQIFSDDFQHFGRRSGASLTLRSCRCLGLWAGLGAIVSGRRVHARAWNEVVRRHDAVQDRHQWPAGLPVDRRIAAYGLALRPGELDETEAEDEHGTEIDRGEGDDSDYALPYGEWVRIYAVRRSRST